MMHENLLNCFSNPLNVAVIGATGGIGKALVNLLLKQKNVKNVHCFSRRAIEREHEKILSYYIELSDEETIAAAASNIENYPLDLILIACGVLHCEDYSPEKSLKDLNMQQLKDVFLINSFGPALVAKYFLPLIPRNGKSVFAALSARVGSIEDNRLGGWYAYRASKAALNMLIKNAAIETARKCKQASVIGLHPGTVNTNLSRPFQSNVQASKLFTPEYSAQCLLEVVNGVTPDQTGEILAWDGTTIPY